MCAQVSFTNSCATPSFKGNPNSEERTFVANPLQKSPPSTNAYNTSPQGNDHIQPIAINSKFIADQMQEVILRKEKNVEKALEGRVNINEAIMIGGDAFTMGYMAFQGAQIVKPSLASISAIGVATLTCGVIAGAINIGVALISLKESMQAFSNGDTKLGFRLLLDFFGLLGIGTIMILASLAIRVAALGAVSSFFAANPWLMPLLFFIISIPIILEIGNRIYNIERGKDLAAQLEIPLDNLTNGLELLIQGQDGNNPFHLAPLLDKTEKDVYPLLARKMEVLQADMGVEAAIEVFKLLRLHLLEEKTEEQLAGQMRIVKEKITEWNRAQYVRMFQQILYTAAFGVSMAALKPSINTPAVNGTETFSMMFANLIPLFMDIFWPFKRNTPIVVPNAFDHGTEMGKV